MKKNKQTSLIFSSLYFAVLLLYVFFIGSGQTDNYCFAKPLFMALLGIIAYIDTPSLFKRKVQNNIKTWFWVSFIICWISDFLSFQSITELRLISSYLNLPNFIVQAYLFGLIINNLINPNSEIRISTTTLIIVGIFFLSIIIFYGSYVLKMPIGLNAISYYITGLILISLILLVITASSIEETKNLSFYFGPATLCYFLAYILNIYADLKIKNNSSTVNIIIAIANQTAQFLYFSGVLCFYALKKKQMKKMEEFLVEKQKMKWEAIKNNVVLEKTSN